MYREVDWKMGRAWEREFERKQERGWHWNTFERKFLYRKCMLSVDKNFSRQLLLFTSWNVCIVFLLQVTLNENKSWIFLTLKNFHSEQTECFIMEWKIHSVMQQKNYNNSGSGVFLAAQQSDASTKRNLLNWKWQY